MTIMPRPLKSIVSFLLMAIAILLRQWNLLLRIIYEISKETIPHQLPLYSSVSVGNLSDSESRTITPTQYTEPDINCPFRHSPLYRSIYAYPSPGDDRWHGDILASSYSDSNTSTNVSTTTSSRRIPHWPSLEIDRHTRETAQVHYDFQKCGAMYNGIACS